MRLVALALVASLFTGCSFVMDASVPATAPSEPPRCGNTGAPYIDLALTAVLGGISGYYFWKSDPLPGEGNDNNSAGIIAPIVLVPALAYGISALVGLSSNSECRQAQRHHQKWLEDNGRSDD